MKFACKLTNQEIIDFIENHYDVKVDWLNLDFDSLPCCSANVKLKKVKQPIHFTFSDYYFMFVNDAIKVKTTKEHAHKCWNIFLYKKYGASYAKSLNEYLNQKINYVKKQAEQRIGSINDESAQFVSYMQTQIESINKQINAEQNHRKEQISEITTDLYQKIGEINSCRITLENELEK